MKQIKLGAPSLGGGDANDKVAKAFGKYDFPLALLICNTAAFAVSFPVINGLHLKSCTDEDGCKQIVTIKDMDQFQRLASDIEAIAELNRHEVLVTIDEPEAIELEVTEEPVKTDEKPTAKAKTTTAKKAK